jgi:hypothetical protein
MALNLGHQFGPAPVHVAGLLGRLRPGEGRGGDLQRRQSAGQGGAGALGEAGADPAGVGQPVAFVDPHQEGPQGGVRPGPAADDHLLAAADLHLDPAVVAARDVRAVELLGDDALQVHIPGRGQHGFAAYLKVVDVAQAGGARRRLVLQHVLQPRLSLLQGQRAQVLALQPEQVKSIGDHVGVTAFGDRGLQRREVRPAGLVHRDDLTVDDAVGQPRGLVRHPAEAVGPVEALAREAGRLAVLDVDLDAVAVQLDLVDPAGAVRGPLRPARQLRLDEAWRGRLLNGGLALRLGVRRSGLRVGRCFLRRPDRLRARLLPRRGHERLGRLALAGGDRLQAAA